MSFWRKARDIQPVRDDEEIPVVVTMKDGRVIKGKTSVKMFTDATTDLRRPRADADSRIYILTIIGHPDEFESVERG